MPRHSTRTKPSAPIAGRFVLADSRSRPCRMGFVEKSPTAGRVTSADVVVGPSSRQPILWEWLYARRSRPACRKKKIVWAGGNPGSYARAEEAMRESAGVSISARRIRHAVNQVGQVGNERVAQPKAAVEQFKVTDLLRRPACNGLDGFGKAMSIA